MVGVKLTVDPFIENDKLVKDEKNGVNSGKVFVELVYSKEIRFVYLLY